MKKDLSPEYTLWDEDDRPIGRILSRREALGLVGVTGLAALIGCGGTGTTTSTTSTTASTGSTASTASTGSTGTTASLGGVVTCVAATPEKTEGPYFVDELLNRSDIRSDTATGAVKAGTVLNISVNLMNLGSNCRAIQNAQIDIWHCDAGGLYSDESANGTVGQNFLRGYQLTDSSGKVTFTTIYPGWYSGRAVHIHFKIRFTLSGTSYEFTSQMFFDESLTTTVHSATPYNTRGTRNTFNSTDGIYGTNGAALLLSVVPNGAAYDATMNVGMIL